MAARQDNAQLIWDALVKVAPRGLTIRELSRATGLNYIQAHYALGLVRQVFMEMYSQPLVCEPGTNRYALPEEWPEERRYLNFRTRVLLSQVLNLERGIAASETKWGSTPQIARIRRDL